MAVRGIYSMSQMYALLEEIPINMASVLSKTIWETSILLFYELLYSLNNHSL